MSKPDELHEEAPKSDFTALPLCGIGYVDSTSTLFEDDMATIITMEPLMENALEASDKVKSKDDASIFGGESDDVPSLAFIHGDGDDMVENGIIHSTEVAQGVEHGDICTYISPTPTYDEMPQFQMSGEPTPYW
ncbi:gag-pol polyprotein [Hordeum vulgare]|nr:gag-pol polyprotein [Hordeum vulgare]